MSEENVEVVRSALEAWQRDDYESWLATIDSAIEWQPAMERLVEGTESAYRGHEGIRRFWDISRSELENFEVESEELRDLGDGRVVLLGRFRWRGGASGITSESPVGMVLTVRDGKIVRSIDYLSHEEALKAVGLEE